MTIMNVAQAIADQIGPRAFYMMGTKHRLDSGDALSFDIRGSREFNKVQITLEPSDTYKVEFFKFRAFERVNYLERSGVYADGLHQCIEHNTGLALSL
jgi:hypothetical protein